MSESYEIPLSQGKVAIVSVEDYEYLMQWKWCASKSKEKWYAKRYKHIGKVDGTRKNKVFCVHRIVMSRMLGHEDFVAVDHRDGDGLNNRRDNLRSATNKQNAENLQGAYTNSKSGIRGVSWHKATKKWVAQIKHDGKKIHLGLFDDIKEAEQSAIAARNEYFTHHVG